MNPVGPRDQGSGLRAVPATGFRPKALGPLTCNSNRSRKIVQLRVPMSTDPIASRLTCGCEVTPSRDFLGRGIGTIVTRGEQCPRPEHVVGHTVLLPGRDNAAPADPRRLG